MKKLMVLVAMLAMALVFVVPVLASEVSQNVGEEITQDSNSEAESSDVGQSFDVTGGGDNANQCPGLTGNGNTAGTQPATGIIQANSQADDFEFDGGGGAQVIQANSDAGDFAFEGDSALTVEGNSTTSCGQQVDQAAAAG